MTEPEPENEEKKKLFMFLHLALWREFFWGGDSSGNLLCEYTDELTIPGPAF